MEKIIQAIVSAVLNYLGLWYEREKAEADEWTVCALEAAKVSAVDADALSAKLGEASPVGAESPTAWNRAITVTLLLLSLSLSGCIVKTVYVEAKMPTIDRPVRPTLVDVGPFSNRERRLALYAAILEAQIDAYNQAALMINLENGYGE